MKLRKKIWAILLTVLMAVSVLPVGSMAEGNEEGSNLEGNATPTKYIYAVFPDNGEPTDFELVDPSVTYSGSKSYYGVLYSNVSGHEITSDEGVVFLDNSTAVVGTGGACEIGGLSGNSSINMGTYTVSSDSARFPAMEADDYSTATKLQTFYFASYPYTDVVENDVIVASREYYDYVCTGSMTIDGYVGMNSLTVNKDVTLTLANCSEEKESVTTVTGRAFVEVKELVNNGIINIKSSTFVENDGSSGVISPNSLAIGGDGSFTNNGIIKGEDSGTNSNAVNPVIEIRENSRIVTNNSASDNNALYDWDGTTLIPNDFRTEAAEVFDYLVDGSAGKFVRENNMDTSGTDNEIHMNCMDFADDETIVSVQIGTGEPVNFTLSTDSDVTQFTTNAESDQTVTVTITGSPEEDDTPIVIVNNKTLVLKEDSNDDDKYTCSFTIPKGSTGHFEVNVYWSRSHYEYRKFGAPDGYNMIAYENGDESFSLTGDVQMDGNSPVTCSYGGWTNFCVSESSDNLTSPQAIISLSSKPQNIELNWRVEEKNQQEETVGINYKAEYNTDGEGSLKYYQEDNNDWSELTGTGIPDEVSKITVEYIERTDSGSTLRFVSFTNLAEGTEIRMTYPQDSEDEPSPTDYDGAKAYIEAYNLAYYASGDSAAATIKNYMAIELWNEAFGKYGDHTGKYTGMFDSLDKFKAAITLGGVKAAVSSNILELPYYEYTVTLYDDTSESNNDVVATGKVYVLDGSRKFVVKTGDSNSGFEYTIVDTSALSGENNDIYVISNVASTDFSVFGNGVCTVGSLQAATGDYEAWHITQEHSGLDASYEVTSEPYDFERGGKYYKYLYDIGGTGCRLAVFPKGFEGINISGAASAAAWGFEKLPVYSVGTEDDPGICEVYYGNDGTSGRELIISNAVDDANPATSAGKSITGISVDTTRISSGVVTIGKSEIKQNEVGTGTYEYKLTFNSAYDEIPLIITFSDSTTGYVDIHRVGINISNSSIVSTETEEGTTKQAKIWHGTDNSAEYAVTSDCEQCITASFYYKTGSKLPENSAKLYATITFKDGTVVRNGITRINTDPVETTGDDEYCDDYIIWSGTDAQYGNIESVSVIAYYEGSTDSFGGVQVGSGTGVKWEPSDEDSEDDSQN